MLRVRRNFGKFIHSEAFNIREPECGDVAPAGAPARRRTCT